MTPHQFDRLHVHGTEVRLWQVDLNAPAEAGLLSSDERERAERLLIPEKRRQFIAARAGLRQILGVVTGRPPEFLIFGVQADGKPFLEDASGWEFNLAHSDDAALVAVARSPVGIDLERERPLSGMAHMAEIAFSPQEQAELNQLPADDQQRAFFRTWTRKEALLKGYGTGFRLAHTFSLPVSDQPLTIAIGPWMITDLETRPGFFAALAIRGPS